MEEINKRRLRFLAGFAVYFAALWLLWSTPFVYPLKIFVVLLHEISHGLVAVATGGSIERIMISASQGGVCQCPGGSAFLTLSAGYLGSLLFGAAILWAARGRGRVPQIAAMVIGLIVVIVTLMYVRNSFGLLFGIAFGGALVIAGKEMEPEANSMLLTALGLTSCLYAILDIKSDVIDRPEVMSDARMLAELTGIPTIIWGIVWIVAALAISAWLFQRALQRAGAEPAQKGEAFKV